MNDPKYSDILKKAKPFETLGNLPITDVQYILESHKPELEAIIRKNSISVQALISGFIDILGKEPKYLKCYYRTILGCLYQLAKLGEDPNPAIDYVSYSAFMNKAKGLAFMKLNMGYRLIQKLIYRNPEVLQVGTGIVLKGEKHSLQEGTTPDINHILDTEKRGNLTATTFYKEVLFSYASVILKNGAKIIRHVPKFALDAVREKSKSPSVWSAFPEEMINAKTMKKLESRIPFLLEHNSDHTYFLTDNGVQSKYVDFDDNIKRLSQRPPEEKSIGSDIPKTLTEKVQEQEQAKQKQPEKPVEVNTTIDNIAFEKLNSRIDSVNTDGGIRINDFLVDFQKANLSKEEKATLWSTLQRKAYQTGWQYNVAEKKYLNNND